MLIGNNSKYYLKKVRAKAKMYEYRVPEDLHIQVEDQANDLILLSIGIIGDIASEIWNMKQAPIILTEEREEELYFVSSFFDSYFQSKMCVEMNPYYILMGAVAYYFGELNGSSKVMMSIMPNLSDFGFSASGLENVVMWMLGDNSREFNLYSIAEKYRSYIAQLIHFYDSFFNCENPKSPNFDDFRKYVYKVGNDRELLFTDIILAIFKKKIYNACINLMPAFSGVGKSDWSPTFKNNIFMKEMWPSQILLGKYGVFKGKSGVIQMPTSSGKTTSVALAIQAAFLSCRTSVAVVVAPFRALCKEIMLDMEEFFAFDSNISVTEFSDVPEYEEVELVVSESITKKIFVMTPEKLAYILKHNTKIVESINLVVFDEAHLFDDESRGTDYELLLATINRYIKPDAQKLLVSAVISNAEQLNAWINNDGVVIRNNTIKTSEKTVAFNTVVSTNTDNVYSNLCFVNPNRFLEEEFYVPRVVQVRKLNAKGKEKKLRYFPDLEKEKNDIGIYYAIKLIKNGSVAIFCSKKDTVNRVLKRFIDLKERGILLDDFITLSKRDECLKIARLIKEHLGENNLYTAALNGIVAHHSNIPNGIRIAEEYALKKSQLHCVVCTSTLAQGVNLPIKYLIISNVYQSNKIIKVRDFHNLIGRTARAGKETEGTIILTENVYKNSDKRYRLNKYKRLLDIGNSEECSSNLLKLVRKIDINDNYSISVESLKKYIDSRYSDYNEYLKLKNSVYSYKEQEKENSLEIYHKICEIEHILISLENFILTFEEDENDTSEIIQSTYGYYLANEAEKKELRHIYNLIKANINNFDDKDKILYKSSMLGIFKMRELLEYVDRNLCEIEKNDFDSTISLIANMLKDLATCKIIPKIIDCSYIHKLLKMWINGESYIKILEYSKSVNLLIKRGRQSREIKLDDIVTLCDSDFGYTSLTIIQALIEVLDTKENYISIQEDLNNIIYRIRYGLPNKESVYIYELGFADRIISQKIASEISSFDCSTKKKTKWAIRKNREKLQELLSDYPSYFIDRLEKI